MNKKNEELYLKHKSHEINALKGELSKIEKEIDELTEKIAENEKLYKEREKENFSDPMALLAKDLFLSALLKENERFSKEIERLNQKLNMIKEILSTSLGEKRAFETYIEKKEKIENIKENEKEAEIANEIFVRKHYHG